MSAQDNLNSTQFFHSTDAELGVGDHVVPAAELNPKNPGRAQRNAMSTGESNPRSTYMTDIPGDTGMNWGRRTYSVKPLGPVSPSRTDTSGHDFESPGHLEVTGLVEDRSPQYEAAQKSMSDYLGSTCEYCGQSFGAHPTPTLNRHSNMAAQGLTGSL